MSTPATTPAMDTHGLIVEFGKHKGERWTRLPVGYLKWLINIGSQYAAIAEAELLRRGSVVEFDIEISGHAIDRASLRCRRIWKKTMREEEGIHSWLYRMAAEALRRKPDAPVILYNGMKFVFEYGEIYPTLKTVMRSDKEPPKNDFLKEAHRQQAEAEADDEDGGGFNDYLLENGKY